MNITKNIVKSKVSHLIDNYTGRVDTLRDLLLSRLVKHPPITKMRIEVFNLVIKDLNDLLAIIDNID